jgi:hypothetical protein
MSQLSLHLHVFFQFAPIWYQDLGHDKGARTKIPGWDSHGDKIDLPLVAHIVSILWGESSYSGTVGSPVLC